MKISFIISLIYFFLFLSLSGKAQFVSVSGFVKHASTGEAKINATVFESRSGIGTITNSEGYYRLLLSPGQQELEISSQGFHKFTSTFNLMADTIVSVELVPNELTEEKAFAGKEGKYKSYDVLSAEKTTKKLLE